MVKANTRWQGVNHPCTKQKVERQKGEDFPSPVVENLPWEVKTQVWSLAREQRFPHVAEQPRPRAKAREHSCCNC